MSGAVGGLQPLPGAVAVTRSWYGRSKPDAATASTRLIRNTWSSGVSLVE